MSCKVNPCPPFVNLKPTTAGWSVCRLNGKRRANEVIRAFSSGRVRRKAENAGSSNILSSNKESVMSEKPTIVLVHGFWGGAAHWAKVIPILARQGYDVHAVENPLTSLADDSARTKKMIAQQKGPVLLVGHSY